MAVGDVVSAIGGSGLALIYQPAAGVEVMITNCFCADTGTPRLYDGVNQASATFGSRDAWVSGFKMFVNNSLYLRIQQGSAGSFVAFTGLQIK